MQHAEKLRGGNVGVAQEKGVDVKGHRGGQIDETEKGKNAAEAADPAGVFCRIFENGRVDVKKGLDAENELPNQTASHRFGQSPDSRAAHGSGLYRSTNRLPRMKASTFKTINTMMNFSYHRSARHPGFQEIVQRLAWIRRCCHSAATAI